MTHYLMTCGHISSAIDEIGDPACPICMCWEIKSELHDDTTGLEGREAHCVYSNDHRTASAWNLPFFEYQPDKPYDAYYCGCQGWD